MGLSALAELAVSVFIGRTVHCSVLVVTVKPIMFFCCLIFDFFARSTKQVSTNNINSIISLLLLVENRENLVHESNFGFRFA